MYDDRIILLDADVIIHFIRGSQIDILPTIYDSEYWIMDRVYGEIPGILNGVGELNRFIRDHDNVLRKTLPMEMDVVQEYAELENRFGNGESAVMAMAFARDEVVASSNINDVEDYCTEKNVDWVTTLDLLAEAYSKKGLLSAQNCNEFIQKVRNSGSKLPNVSIQEYIRNN